MSAAWVAVPIVLVLGTAVVFGTWWALDRIFPDPRGTRFPNGIPRVESDQSPYTLDSVFALRNRMWGETYQAPPPESLKWDLPEDPFDPSDWLDDLDWDDWDEVGKTSSGDPVYIKPLSNGREHG